jgi:hypothetical protein
MNPPMPMPIDTNLREAYRALEERMKTLAEDDGDIYLPNPEPDGSADYIVICMEPSLGRWAHSQEEARLKVATGFRNFLFSIEDFILHFCIRHYLCGPGQRYHITDLSKGALLTERAGIARQQRYDRWYSLFEEEIRVVATSDAKFVAVGNAVAGHLVRRGFPRPFTKIIHYSGRAAKARKDGIVGHEKAFEAFRASFSVVDFFADAQKVLEAARVPCSFAEEVLLRLGNSHLSLSRIMLMFNYRTAFGVIRNEARYD